MNMVALVSLAAVTVSGCAKQAEAADASSTPSLPAATQTAESVAPTPTPSPRPSTSASPTPATVAPPETEKPQETAPDPVADKAKPEAEKPAAAASSPPPSSPTPPPPSPASDYPDGVNVGAKVSATDVCAAINHARATVDYLIPYGPVECFASADMEKLVRETAPQEPDGMDLNFAVGNEGRYGATMFSHLLSLDQIRDGKLSGGAWSGYYTYETPGPIGIGSYRLFWWNAETNSLTAEHISCAFST